MASRHRARREQRTPPAWWLDEHNRTTAENAVLRRLLDERARERDDIAAALGEATAGMRRAAAEMTILNRLAQAVAQD